MKEEYIVLLLIKISDDLKVKAEKKVAERVGETFW